jgi:hypothetical protein
VEKRRRGEKNDDVKSDKVRSSLIVYEFDDRLHEQKQNKHSRFRRLIIYEDIKGSSKNMTLEKKKGLLSKR